MKKLQITILLFALLGSSCTLLKDRSVDKVKIRELEKSQITSPGAQIAYFPPTYAYPLSTPDKQKKGYSPPKNQIRKDTLIKGENGSEMWVLFNPDGTYKGSICDCPAVKKITETDKRIKEKQVESKMNLDLARQAKYTIWGVALVFAIAWIVRKKA